MGPSEQKRPQFGPGLSLLSLLGSQLVLLYLLDQELARAFVLKPEQFFGRLLPSLVWPLCAAWFLSAWLARRRPGSTAIPLGYHLGWALAFVGLLMRPFYLSTVGGQPIRNLEQGVWMAWTVGIVVTLAVGCGQLILALVRGLLMRPWSLPLLQFLGGVVALTTLAAYRDFLLEQPLYFVISAGLLLAFHRLQLPRPFGLSVAWLLLICGAMCSLVSGTTFEVAALPGALLPQPRLELVPGAAELLWLHPQLLALAIPLALWALVRDAVLLEGADRERSRSHLLGLGLFNLGGAALGCGLPLGVLPGFSAIQRWSGGQFYSQAAGWCMLLLATTGGFDGSLGWLPLPVLVMAWGYLLLTSAGHSCQQMPAHRAWWAAALAPWLLFSEPDFNRLLIGLLWGGLAMMIEVGRYDRAAWISLMACLVASTGMLHGGRWEPDFNLWSLTYFVLGAALRAAWYYHQEIRPPAKVEPVLPAEIERILSDSSDSPGTSVFGIPADSRPAEGAGSGSAS